MEFNQKLQELRKQKGLTQEELANALFVSRTAVSKWESGRGYPGIDSLKAISEFFSVSIDDLLSGNELLNAAKEENKKQEEQLRGTFFGLLDVSTILLFFLPLFAQRTENVVLEVSLLAFSSVSPYLKAAYILSVAITVIFGILTLATQNCRKEKWLKTPTALPLALNLTGALLFILSLQAYAAIFVFLILCIKGYILIKHK